MLLARKIRALRLIYGWTQEKLASACGLHRTYISLVERGGCNVTIDNLEKIADAFGLSIPDLMGVPDAAFGEKLLSAMQFDKGGGSEEG
jgi:transcriptional regulator with XRE-family HTH domain